MPLRRHARTLSIVRLLHAIGPVKRRRRLPKQQQPDAIRREYYRALLPFIDAIRDALARTQGRLLHLLREERRAQGKMDASHNVDEALELVDRASKQALADMKVDELKAAAKKFASRTSAFQKEQLGRQVEAAMGVPLSSIEKPIVEKLEGFAALNVDLIKTTSSRYFDRVRQDVLEAFEKGARPEELADLWSDPEGPYGMMERDAMRIARDQIGKLNGQLNEERQTAMGVTGYTWRTMNDASVRDQHADREGKHFEWDDPPEDGHPGEPIQCRCYAEPDFGAILEDL